MRIENDVKKALTIACRSKKNLEYIYKQKEAGEDVEEFTQLFNSMLGMLICLREDYLWGESVKWDDIEAIGLKKVIINDHKPKTSRPNLVQVNSFSQLITNLRHSFAHSNFKFINRQGQIKGLRVWNMPPKLEKKDRDKKELRIWQADLSEEQIKEVTFLLIDYLQWDLNHTCE